MSTTKSASSASALKKATIEKKNSGNASVDKKASAPVEKKSKAPEDSSKAKPKVTKKKTEAPAEEKPVEKSDTVDEKTSSTDIETTDIGTTDAGTVIPAVIAVDNVVNIEEQIDRLLAQKEADRTKVKEEIQALRTLKKTHAKLMRDMLKNSKKSRQNKSKNGPRKYSGFAQSTRISPEMCAFLDEPIGTKIARTDVTKRTIKYIKEKNLEMSDNHRNIQPDEVLEKLVGNAEERMATMQRQKLKKENTVVTDILSYFNLQIHLNRHFIKEEKTKAVEESSAATVSA